MPSALICQSQELVDMDTSQDEVLSAIPLFQAFPEHELADLSAKAGDVKVIIPAPDGGELILSLLGPATFLGGVSVIDGQPRSASVISTRPVETAVLTRQDFGICS